MGSRCGCGSSGASLATGGPLVYYIAASNAPQAQKDRADAVADGTADNVKIATGLAAVKAAGGGTVLLSQGDFNLAAQVVISGFDDLDIETDIGLVGAGPGSTRLIAAPGLASAVHLTGCVRAHVADFGIAVAGLTHGVSSSRSTVPAGAQRGFWQSTLRNIQVVGPADGTHSGWAFHLGSAYGSVFEHLEGRGVGNGIRCFTEEAGQAPGGLTFIRCFMDLYGTNRFGYSVDAAVGSTSMSHIVYIGCSAIGDGAGCKGIWLGGAGDSSHIRVIGGSLEVFDTLVEVDRGEGNRFDLGYLTPRAASGLTAFKFGVNAWNNEVMAAGKLEVATGTMTLVNDANTAQAAKPNAVRNVGLAAPAGTTVTQTVQPRTITENITNVGTGTVTAVAKPPAVDVTNRPVALADAATVAVDASLGNIYRCTLLGNRTIGAPTNPTDGQVILLELAASGAARTPAFTSGAGGFTLGNIVVSAIAINTTDIAKAVYNATANRWRLVEIWKNYT